MSDDQSPVSVDGGGAMKNSGWIAAILALVVAASFG
jgi:hypothetical protein